jgi:predicted metalloprotease with PDZ domain
MMPMRSCLACLIAVPLFAQNASENAVRLRVDATDAPRRIFHVRMTLTAKPGPMTLLYPKWIPGEHGPTGPIENLVGLEIKSGGQNLRWRRDDVNLYAFHINVPAAPGGEPTLDVTFDVISAPDASGFSSGSSTTTELAVLNWNQLLLYPAGAPADALQYQTSLRVPDSWKYGTALPIDRESSNDVDFKPASLTTLVDSPLSTGRHYRTVGIGSDNGIPHYVHFAGDSEVSVAVPDDLITHYRSLVNETGALFQSRHYRSYHFLVTLSDHVANFGLEHHESSDDRVKERTLIESYGRTAEASLLSHEFVHSWNGKYRRPDGLASGGGDGGYDAPMKGELLWIYEGLTNYLGEILAARSGLWTNEEYRDALAGTAAEMDTRSGRAWRPLEDTAVFAQVLYDTGDDYRGYRRSTDYYEEGSLIWLEVDTLIRQLSKGTKSLDDFCRAFLGGPGGAPAMKTYSFKDVVTSLNAVETYDWVGYFKQRLQATSSHAPLGGIERGGWKLVYTPERSGWWRADEEYHKRVDLTYSIGLKVNEDGSILDVAYDGPARKAGVTPSVKLIAVNGREFTPTLLREAVKASVQHPVELLIKNGEFYETHSLQYSGGERYPRLVREETAPDLLTQVIASKARDVKNQ